MYGSCMETLISVSLSLYATAVLQHTYSCLQPSKFNKGIWILSVYYEVHFIGVVFHLQTNNIISLFQLHYNYVLVGSDTSFK